jgi:L-seryl-tRNA(Ser) seleniumtransferase
MMMTDADTNELLRAIPAMDELLNAPWAGEFLGVLGRVQVKAVIGRALDEIRGELCGGAALSGSPEDFVASRAVALLRAASVPTLRPVVNATGVVIHTNLGRAPLAASARRAVAEVAGAYSTLEYSPEEGGRSGRGGHVEESLRRLTGAEAAVVVNNNAAAVLLALSATASGREVLVSAGELVEIGGSFRIPRILAFSGARMRVVGCTNSTRLEDFREAVTENTAVILKVHPSNYRIDGFVKSVSRQELAGLAATLGLVLIEDLGSGILRRPEAALANREETVRDCLVDGSGIVTFSGDKLLGGPQIGVIAGSATLIDGIRSHQLLRALRVDKMTLAAFDATLRLYLAGKEAEIPVIRMVEADGAVLLEKARRLRRLLQRRAAALGAGGFEFSVVETEDAVGGGAFPTDTLPGYGVGIRSASVGAEALAAALRTASIPVVAAIREGRVVLHVRALLDGDERRIAAAFELVLPRCLGGPQAGDQPPEPRRTAGAEGGREETSSTTKATTRYSSN